MEVGLGLGLELGLGLGLGSWLRVQIEVGMGTSNRTTGDEYWKAATVAHLVHLPLKVYEALALRPRLAIGASLDLVLQVQSAYLIKYQYISIW